MGREIWQAGCKHVFNKLPGLTLVYSPFSLRYLEWILLARNVSADWGRLVLCCLILCHSYHILALFFPFGFYTSFIFAFFSLLSPWTTVSHHNTLPSVCNLLLIFMAFLHWLSCILLPQVVTFFGIQNKSCAACHKCQDCRVRTRFLRSPSLCKKKIKMNSFYDESGI